MVEPDAAQWRQTSRPDYDLQIGGTAISTNITGVTRVPSIETRGAVAGDVTTPVKLRLSSLWVSVMLCYIYGDIFSFFKPGTLKDILAGDTGAFGSQGGLLAAAILMAIPSVMVFLSLALKPRISRYANIVLGLAYTAVIASTIPGAWAFYVFLGVVEAMLTLTIAWYAWRWQA